MTSLILAAEVFMAGFFLFGGMLALALEDEANRGQHRPTRAVLLNYLALLVAAVPLVLAVLLAVHCWRSGATLPLLVLWSPVIAMVPATPLVALIIHVSQVSGLRSREKIARTAAAQKS